MKKIALVTGSTRGIGHAIAMGLGREGYHVIISGTKELSAMPGLLEGFAGIDCEYKKCNIAEETDRADMFAFLREKGRLDVLVNNAGVAPLIRADILTTTPESVERLLHINLEGTFFMCQAAANLMREGLSAGLSDYRPRIINISSMSAYTSSTNRGEYCMSKAGISMVTKLFADRLAEEGIPVFEVRPGIIETDMTAGVKEKYERLIAGGVTPIKRMGQPEDVANCVLAAASGLLDFGTGTVLNADGGFHIQRL